MNFKWKKRKYDMVWICIFVAYVCAFLPKQVVFAGGINGNEASVIAAASGTFSYEGKTYRAGSAYINSLINYLSADDVDLTADQANEAISTMYASVADGVAQGYLYDVDADTRDTSEPTTEEDTGDEDEEGDDSEAPLEADGLDDVENNPNEKPDDEQEETVAPQNEDTGSTELDVWETMSNPTENKKKLEERPEPKDASASLELQEKEIIVTTKDKEEISIPKDEPIISNKIVFILTIVSGIMFGMTAVCGVVLFSTKCMSFKKHKGRKARPGHSRRRKIRHYTRAVMTVTTAISLIGIFLLLGMYLSLFNDDAIMQNMQSSGYFRYAYSEYITKQAEELLPDLQGAIQKGEVQSLQTYDAYLFTIKKNSLRVLSGNMDVVIPDSNVAPYIYNLKVCCKNIFLKAGLFMIGSVCFGIFLMIFMDQRRERGMKHTAVSMLAASGVMAVLTVVMLVCKPYTLLYIEPDYLYLFMMECIKRCITILTSITAFGVVLGMLCIGIYKMMKNQRVS